MLIYHPMMQPGNQTMLSQDLRDRLFIASIEIIEYSRILENEATTKQWGWLFHTYIQWHAIAFVLGELGQRGNSATVERAWRAMHGVFDAWGGTVVLNKRHMLWQPMRQLMAKARRKREENKQDLQGQEFGIDGKLDEAITTSRGAPGNSVKPGVLSSNASNTFIPMKVPITQSYTPDGANLVEPQVVGMGMLAPEQVQLQLQQQQADLPLWTMDDTFPGMDMAGLEDEPNWNGWEDMVRDYQLESDLQGRGGDIEMGGRVPNIGSNMGNNWW